MHFIGSYPFIIMNLGLCHNSIDLLYIDLMRLVLFFKMELQSKNALASL